MSFVHVRGMQKKRTKKLAINHETIKRLDRNELREVAGGTNPTLMNTHCMSCGGSGCISQASCVSCYC